MAERGPSYNPQEQNREQITAQLSKLQEELNELKAVLPADVIDDLQNALDALRNNPSAATREQLLKTLEENDDFLLDASADLEPLAYFQFLDFQTQAKNTLESIDLAEPSTPQEVEAEPQPQTSPEETKAQVQELLEFYRRSIKSVDDAPGEPTDLDRARLLAVYQDLEQLVTQHAGVLAGTDLAQQLVDLKLEADRILQPVAAEPSQEPDVEEEEAQNRGLSAPPSSERAEENADDPNSPFDNDPESAEFKKQWAEFTQQVAKTIIELSIKAREMLRKLDADQEVTQAEFAPLQEKYEDLTTKLSMAGIYFILYPDAKYQEYRNKITELREELKPVGTLIDRIQDRLFIKKNGNHTTEPPKDPAQNFDLKDYRTNEALHPDEVKAVRTEANRLQAQLDATNDPTNAAYFDPQAAYRGASSAIEYLQHQLTEVKNLYIDPMSNGTVAERQQAIILRDRYIKPAESVVTNLQTRVREIQDRQFEAWKQPAALERTFPTLAAVRTETAKANPAANVDPAAQIAALDAAVTAAHTQVDAAPLAANQKDHLNTAYWEPARRKKTELEGLKKQFDEQQEGRTLEGKFTRLNTAVNAIEHPRTPLERQSPDEIKALEEELREAWKVLLADASRPTEKTGQAHLDRIRDRYKDAYTRALEAVGAVHREKPVSKMTIEEVVEELANTFFIKSERAQDLGQRFLDLIGSVEDEQLKAWYKVRVGLQAVAAKGDSGTQDFAILFDQIGVNLSDKGVGYLEIARGLFLKPPHHPGRPVTKEEMNNAPVNLRAIELYEYIVARIRDKNGGIVRDPSDPTDDDFSYNKLVDDRIKKFVTHLHDKFSDIDRPLLDELIKYAQVTAAKSAGYVPWLARETTRAHGTTLAGLRGDTFRDELFAAAPFAAGFYSRGRYANNKPDPTAEDVLFMDQSVVQEYVQNTPYANKKAGAKDLWDVVVSFRKAIWGEIPQWVMDVRKLIRDGRLDIDDNWFPMPGEVVIDILKMEHEKREVLASGDPARIAEFGQRAYELGHGAKKNVDNRGNVTYDLSNVGIPYLSITNLGQYDLAFTALGKLFSSFQETPHEMTHEQAVNAFNDFMNKIIGKAKLIPGEHQLLFGPMTMRMIHRLAGSYEARMDVARVDELRRDLLKELAGAGGVPQHVKEYCMQFIGKKTPQSLVRYNRPLEEQSYIAKKYRFEQGERRDIMGRIAKILPGGIGKRDQQGLSMQLTAPWEWKEVKKDTSK